MEILIADPRIRARVQFAGAENARLTVTFPAEPRYVDRMMAALSELLQTRFDAGIAPDHADTLTAKAAHVAA